MKNRRLIKRSTKYFLSILLVMSLTSCLSNSVLEYNAASPLELNKWDYFWGDAEINEVITLEDSVNGDLWNTLTGIDRLPERENHKTVWLRTKLPEWKGNSPAVFISRAQEVFEAYMGSKKVYENYDFDRKEEILIVSSNWYLIELPDLFSGKYLYIRAYSNYRNIGVPPPVMLGSTITFIEKLFSSHIIEFVIGILITILAIIFLVVFLLKERTFFNLGTTVFFFAIGIFILGCTPLTQLILPSLKLSYYSYNLSFFFEAFLYLIIEKVAEKRHKRMFRWLWGIHFVYFIVALVLVFTTSLTLEDVVEPFIIILASTGCFTLYVLLRYSFKGSIESKILLSGILLFMISGMTETVFYYSNVLTNNYYLGFKVFHYGGLWFVLSIIILYAYRYFERVRQKEIAQKLALEQTEIAYDVLQKSKAAQESFSQQLITSQDDERRRLANDLHDSIGQELLIIKNMASLSLRDELLSDETKEFLTDISDSAVTVINDIRNISRNLYPYQLENLGLTKSLTSLMEKGSKISGIKFVSDIDEVDKVLEKHDEIHVYRILQESINNVLKHSEAENVTVSMKKKYDVITITIHDDGKGFDADNLQLLDKNGNGQGLKGMQERVKILQGEITVSSTIDIGTTTIVKIPLNHK